MKLTLGSNIAAFGALRALDNSTRSLAQVFERLASGQRINRASDDAAGLAIADTLRTDARLFAQASRNINDGVSMVNIMDSALSSQIDILTRMRELAQQSANGTYTDAQRSALQSEYESLTAEFERIAESLQFNGQDLLSNSSLESIAIQAGITGDLNSLLSFDTADTGALTGVVNVLGDISSIQSGTPEGSINIFDILFFNAFATGSYTREEIENALGTALFETTATDSEGNQRDVIVAITEVNSFNNPGEGTSIMTLVKNEDTGLYENGSITNGLSFDDLGEAPASLNIASTVFGAGATIEMDFTGLTFNSQFYNGAASESAINTTYIDTTAGALNALSVVENRMTELSALRGELGATLNRLSTANNVVHTTRQNLLDAESRIRDADIAIETANLVRSQLIQQASTAILAQANQQPALVLQLLSGLG